MALLETFANLESICRLCLKQESGLSSIFSSCDDESEAKFVERINSVALIQIDRDDGLPSSICEQCRELVDKFYDFRILVEVSDRMLRSCLQDAEKVKDEPSDDVNGVNVDKVASEDEMLAVNAILVPVENGMEVWNVTDCKTDAEPSKNRKLPRGNQTKSTKYPCADCGLVFPSAKDLTDHSSCHEADVDFPDGEISCQLCFESFERVADLKCHIGEHFPESRTQTEVLTETKDDSFYCYGCKRSFPTKDTFAGHMKLHFPVKPFKCRYCRKHFARIAAKKYHEQAHLSERRYSCDECERSFSKRSELRYHKGTHVDTPPFCAVCGKTFQNVQSYKIHAKRHTLGSRFGCATCGKSYYSNSELARHVQQHSGKRKFPCQLCEMSFLSNPELNRHLKYHRGDKKFKCKVCCKSYYESGHLKVHERVHTGERPFACRVCNKAFISKSKLMRHEKIHFKEKVKCEAVS